MADFYREQNLVVAKNLLNVTDLDFCELTQAEAQPFIQAIAEKFIKQEGYKKLFWWEYFRYKNILHI
jgi:hypothetical protein